MWENKKCVLYKYVQYFNVFYYSNVKTYYLAAIIFVILIIAYMGSVCVCV